MFVIKYYWEWFLLLMGLVYWAITAPAISMTGVILSAILPQKIARSCGRFLLQKDFQFFVFLLKITGLLILDDKELKSLTGHKEAIIIAPNHTALWDIVFIAAQVPEAVCVMKGAILSTPLLGGGGGACGLYSYKLF
jgi:1-acyl-sn-glycerol-3-phosphate acyltransferase